MRKKILLFFSITFLFCHCSSLYAQCYGTVQFDTSANAGSTGSPLFGNTTFDITTTHCHDLIMIAYNGWNGPGSGPVTVNGNPATYINNATNGNSGTASVYAYEAAAPGTYTIVCSPNGFNYGYYTNFAAAFYASGTGNPLTIASLTNNINTIACTTGGSITDTITTAINGSMIYCSAETNEGQTSPYPISWIGATFLGSTHTEDGIDAGDAYEPAPTPGRYTITDTNSSPPNNGCGGLTIVLVVIPPPVCGGGGDLVAVPTVSNPTCGNCNGHISIAVSNGTSPYTYNWTPHVSSSDTASNLCGGTYTCDVLDASCKDTTLIFTLPAYTLGLTDTLTINEKCYGDCHGSSTAIPHGGTAPYTYSWTPGGQTTAAASSLCAGSYTVTVNDNGGCSATASVTITQPPPITDSISSSVATCIDTNGAINVTAKDGVSPYTYLWNPGGGSSSNYTGISSGTYTVTIKDANGCQATASGYVGINKTFSVSVSVVGHDTVCKGQSTVLDASGGSSYLWSQGSTSSSVTVSPVSTTTYTVVGKTGVCSDSVSYKVSVFTPLGLTQLPNDSICPGQAVTLKIEAGGGKPPYTYAWNNGITNNSPGPITVTPTLTTIYSLLVTDGCNYTATDSAQITVVPLGTAAFFFSPDTVTDGEPVIFTNTSTASAYYLWSFGDGGTSATVNPTYAYADTGIYQVILVAYNAHGCFDSATADVHVEHKIIIPNVFTPNGDGINDVFYFTILGAQCFHCDIYNRWGKLIYQIGNIKQGWDGTIQHSGQPAPDGTYYYTINYCNYDNAAAQLDGFIELIGNKK